MLSSCREVLAALLILVAIPNTSLADTITVPPVYVDPDDKCTGEDCDQREQPAIFCQGQNCLPQSDNPVVECQGQNCLPPAENRVMECEGLGCTPEPEGD